VTDPNNNGKGFLDFARNASEHNTTQLFTALHVYNDLSSRSAAINMAMDEALLETAQVPSIRFYRWGSPALSFGYFGRFADVAAYAGERDLVRRWTGGGIVFHGEDLTYSIVIPATDPLFRESSQSIYAEVHRALRDVLVVGGENAQLASVAAVSDRRGPTDSAIRDRRYSECFANPVNADLMFNGRKIAGAAQRRSRRGLLQQGSIQHVDFGNGLAEQFSQALSRKCEAREIGSELLARTQKIVVHKYGTEAWLRRR
jgi:lipoate-protein ligase A